ncbi:MAG TPA: DUF952 domain-containing protein [Aquihabitans sp.]|jgi:uncharacterized protein (DUF952 family)|nr:DUF952 domain-containing protein [Aquihabitans sp.]
MITLDPDGLYHLASAEEWAEHQASGEIVPPSLAAEGFVHCSWGHQVAGTVGRHFPGRTDLLALALDRSALGDLALVEEDTSGSGQAYPHVYGPVPVAAVTATTPLGPDGEPA